MTLPLFELVPSAAPTQSPRQSLSSVPVVTATSDGRVLYCWQPRFFTAGQQLWIWEEMDTKEMEWMDWESSGVEKWKCQTDTGQ